MKSANFRRAGDAQKYNGENAEFMASSIFAYLENLYVHGTSISTSIACV